MQRFSRALLLAFFPASFAWSGAGGAAFYLLAACGVALAASAIVRGDRHAGRVPRDLTLAALALAGINLASVLLFELRAREFSWLALLLIPLLAVVAARAVIGMRELYTGAALGGMAALGVALVDWLVNAAPRPSGSLNPIVFGELSAVCALWALAGAVREGGGWRGVLYGAGAAAGVAAVVASGTRGALLALPLLAVLAWRSRNPRREPRVASPHARRALIAGAAAIALAAMLIGPRLPIWERFGELDDEYTAFRQGDVGTKSFSQRLAMWRASLTMVAERPWLGVGAHRFKPELHALQARGEYPADSIVFSHPHNLFLSVLVQYGAAGFALLLLAGGLAWRAMGRAPPEQALLGRLTITAWALLGLTNDVFAHQSVLRFVAIGLALCAAAHAPRARVREA